MIGAGVFTVWTPAAATAGAGLLVSLASAGLVAYLNAMSTARLAARYPASGGAYVYGRERLGGPWGFLAGWMFLVGKTASCAAMALTIGVYLWPEYAGAVAAAAVVVLTAVNYVGVQKSSWLTRGLVGLVLAVLVILIAVGFARGDADPGHLDFGEGLSVSGVLQAAGLMFFAFAGYARIATLGEEVADPAHTIRRAIPVALAITVVLYALIGIVLLLVLGPSEIAADPAPLAALARLTGLPGLDAAVTVAAVCAATGALLTLVLGVSRTTLALARDLYLPSALAAVHPRFGVPHRAELMVGAVVVAIVLTVDLRGAIGFSSFGVLLYYAVANVAAATLPGSGWTRIRAGAGLAGCLLLAVTLPLGSVLAGLAVAALGFVVYLVR